MKKILLITMFIFLTISSFSRNLNSLIDSTKIESIGYSFQDEISPNFRIIQKIKENKNSKLITFWHMPNLTIDNISTLLFEENSKNFTLNNKFEYQGAKITKYNFIQNETFHIYDIVFKSKKEPDILISINFIGKVILNNTEIESLIREAESFVK